MAWVQTVHETLILMSTGTDYLQCIGATTSVPMLKINSYTGNPSLRFLLTAVSYPLTGCPFLSGVADSFQICSVLDIWEAMGFFDQFTHSAPAATCELQACDLGPLVWEFTKTRRGLGKTALESCSVNWALVGSNKGLTAAPPPIHPRCVNWQGVNE